MTTSVQKLSWAGIKIVSQDTCILIDAVENYSMTPRFTMHFEEPVFPFSEETSADFVVLTHLHLDHYDKSVVHRCLKKGGRVLCSALFEDRLRADGVDHLVPLELNQSFEAGRARFQPVFALDGIGDQQVSWVIEVGGKRFFHGGDTIWHNQFWDLGKRWGPIDAAFLPVNGPVVRFSFLPFSPVPAALTPVQSVSAARLLQAQTLIPIHYGFHEPGIYEDFPDMKNTLLHEAHRAQQAVRFLQAGEVLAL
jgi:L-ascorbate metabolism protein UlaG (beta-lactamase superfamily)